MKTIKHIISVGYNAAKTIGMSILFLMCCCLNVQAGAGWWDEGGVELTFLKDGAKQIIKFNKDGWSTPDWGEVSSLSLKELQCKVWKDNNGNICGAQMYYTIDGGNQTPITPNQWYGSYDQMSGVTNQIISISDLTTDLLQGLAPGEHTFTCWFKATGNSSSNNSCGEDFWYSNNNSSNYSIKFSVPDNSSTFPSYYYRGTKNGWGDGTQLTPSPTELYAYLERNGDDEFKITKVPDSWNPQYNSNNINNTFSGANVELVPNDENIICKQSGKWYILVWYPDTECNTTDQPVICAATTLPDNCSAEYATPEITVSTPTFSTEVNTPITLSGISVTPSCSYQWTATGGTLTDETTLTPTFTAASAGTYTLTLTATNGDKTATATCTVNVTAAIERPELYYMDDYFTGWGDGKGKQMSWDGEDHLYAYIQWSAYDKKDNNNNDNKFKIYPANKNDDKLKYFGGDYIVNGFAGTNIPLSNDEEWHNAKNGSTTSSYYVFLFMPNTAVNPSDKHILCAGYTMPVFSDPYPVSFGVIDNQGGTLTAKSGDRIIDSGDAVTFATFTAVPETGYTIEGWYADFDGTIRIDAAGTASTYTLSSVTEDNNQVYVRFRQVEAIYFKQNGLSWNNQTYLYLFSADVWSKAHRTEDGHTDEEKGVQPKENRIGDVLPMEQVHDDVFGHVLTGQLPTYLAFCKDNQSDYGNLYQTEAVYLYQFNSAMPLFVHERDMEAYRTNEVNYFNDGIWMKYNSTLSGYSLVWRQGNDETRVPFTAPTAGGYEFAAVVQATAGQTYTLCVANERGEYYSHGDNAVLSGTEEAYRLYVWGDWANHPAYVSFTPAVSGNYTITLSLADGKVIIGFGEEPGAAYRLVYVEKTNATTKVFHPSHSIATRRQATAEKPLSDTISLHVRPFLKDAAGAETANANQCEVWLQKQTPEQPSVWTTLSTIDVKNRSEITGNGVYNFVIEQRGNNDVSLSNIHAYTGTYYIRCDAALRVGGGGFDNNYLYNLENRCTYSEYARNYENFDYYFCQWVLKGTNVKYVIANPYSYCITDTLIQNTYERDKNFVASDGKLQNNANIRFMWNSYDNSLDRAYLDGAGYNVQVLSDSRIYDSPTGNSPTTTVQLQDMQNWVYSADVYADANAMVKVLAPYQGTNQYFKGQEGDYSAENTYPLITGKRDSENRYKIRVIYDFKTNHLICAWLVGGTTIEADDEIDTDLMIIRTNQGQAEQLSFNPDERKISEVKNVYCVLTITKEYLQSAVSSKEKSVYWVSFPFDVRLTEVFGGGLEYGNDYMVQYYDGVARAEYGCWIDSPTYWKYYETTTGVTLRQGHGYVVVLDWQRILGRAFTNNNTTVSLYFPSSNTDMINIDGKITDISYAPHPCSIERGDRYIYDSNWNLIGAPSYANVDKFGNPKPAEQIGEFKVGFLYRYEPANGKFVTSACTDTTFYSMYSYMAQFAGTIKWQDGTCEGEFFPEELKAPRRAAAENLCHTLRLVLQHNGIPDDQTFVRFQDADATEAFDMNIDLAKLDNADANLYTLTADDAIRVAANVQPVPAHLKQIPVGVSLTEDGEYTFALPDATDGMSVVLVDTETGIRTDLLLNAYTVRLSAGVYDARFLLEVNPKRQITTAGDNVGTNDNQIRKYLINGNLYIRKGNAFYDIQGRQLQAW